MLFQRQNAQGLTCWSLLNQRLKKLLVVENLLRRLQRVWESKLWENNWVSVVNRGESFQQNLLSKPVAREEASLQTFLVEHVKQQFSVPTFCGSVWKSWRESPNCWRCPVFAWTRKFPNYLTWWKLHRVWIPNGSELWRWFWPFLALKLKFFKAVVTRLMRKKKRKRSTKMTLLFLLEQELSMTKNKRK